MDLPSLTSLRFIAAFLVVAYHVSLYIPPGEWLTAASGIGYSGVSFFFVLSGFVLTWTHRDGDSARAFYGRRFARVWPLHMLVTLVVALSLLAQNEPQNPLGFALVTVLAQAWAPPGSLHYAYNGPSWTLSCEAFFYAVFPLLVASTLRTGRALRLALLILAGMATTVLGVIAAAPYLAPFGRVTESQLTGFLLYVAPAYRVGEFIIGMLLAAAIRRGWRSPVPLWLAGTVAAASYVTVATSAWLTSGGSPMTVPYGIVDLLMVPAFALLIATAASSDIHGASGLLHRPALVRLGQWSFALYLVHEVVIRAAMTYFPVEGVAPRIARSVVTVLLAVLLAGIAHQLFERPVERYLRQRLARPPRTGRTELTVIPAKPQEEAA